VNAQAFFSCERGTKYERHTNVKEAAQSDEIFKKPALTLTFLYAIIYNCTSIGKLRNFDLFEVLFLKKEQKKNNPKGWKSTAGTRCNSKRGDCFLWCTRFKWGSTASA